MLKKSITFVDPFTEEKTTEVHYFHLSKSELIEMELGAEGGSLASKLQSVGQMNSAEIVKMFKSIILKSYGVKSGGKFVKSDQIAEEFAGSAAYDALFFELVTSEGASANFIKGVVPKDLLDAQGNMPETIQLPPAEKLADDKVKETRPWILEDRDPTPRELILMSQDDMVHAFQRKSQS